MSRKARRLLTAAALLALWCAAPRVCWGVAEAESRGADRADETPVTLAAVPEPGTEPDAAADATADATARRCRVRVTSEQSSRRKAFSATEILDLDFEVRLGGDIDGEHLLRLAIYTPAGHLYQTLTVPFSTDPVPLGARRSVEGFPRPLEVQATRRIADGEEVAETVTARLPVAGTAIVHSSLYGRWSAQAFLDDEAGRCGRPVVFSIQP